MSIKSIDTQHLSDIANAIRKKTNRTDDMAISDMAKEIGSIATDGVELPELENKGSASDLLSGKQLIDQDGNVVTGTIPTKTESNLIADGATVTVPAGYYAAQATKSVAIATQATPSISINSSGLITATATQTAGYVAAGSKSATKQLAFQAAKTITPSTASQIAVSSGYYTGGDVTVAGDSNLVAENIKSGVSIFGINGAYEGSGGDTNVEDAILTRTLSGIYTNDRVTTITSAISYNFQLKSVNFPKVKYIYDWAFASCAGLISVSFPEATRIYSDAFYSCAALSSADFPKVTYIYSGAFKYCSNLASVNFPVATNIGSDAFYGCSKLSSVSFPMVTSIGAQAFVACGLTSVCFPNITSIDDRMFVNCRSLSYISFPNVSYISNSAFGSCYNLTSVNFPVATDIGMLAFASCSSLTLASFPVATGIRSAAFSACYHLISLYLTGSSLCALSHSNAFNSTPIGGYSISAGTYGSIYVPVSLLTSYQTATNWAYFSSRFVGYGEEEPLPH